MYVQMYACKPVPTCIPKMGCIILCPRKLIVIHDAVRTDRNLKLSQCLTLQHTSNRGNFNDAVDTKGTACGKSLADYYEKVFMKVP